MPKLPKFQLAKPKFDMMLQLQIKFVAVAMSILIAVFLVMLSSINMMMKTVSQHQSMQLLRQIALSDRYNSVDAPEDLPPEEPPQPMAETAVRRSAVITVQQLANRYWWEQEDATGWWENEDWENNWGNHWGTQTTTAPKPEPPQRPTRPNPEQEQTRPIPIPPVEMTTPPPPTTAEPPTTESVTETTTTPPPPPTEEETPAPETEPPPVVYPEDPVEPETVPETTTTETTTTETIATTTTTETTTTTTTPPPVPPAKPNKWNITITIDHFALLVGHDGEFLGLRNTEDYTYDEAANITKGILASGEPSGMYGWLQYYSVSKEYGKLIVVTDKTSDQGLLNNLFRITVIVGCIMLLVLFAVLCVLSKWITSPVRTAFKRQKQFVSDAGHELKTPLTVLSANADILQDEIGENKWLGYMQEQTARMNQLVGDLLHLARMDNATQEYEMMPFNLSAAINATALPFESQAFEMHKNLELDIQSGVEYCGSEKHIRQLAAIFIDNAMKYSDENGIIKVTLMKRGDKAVLEFYNTGCEISQAETEKIFERFYRGDKARSSKGKNGYGLGLAIAKSIMDIHKIRIQVTCKQGKWIRFLLTM